VECSDSPPCSATAISSPVQGARQTISQHHRMCKTVSTPLAGHGMPKRSAGASKATVADGEECGRASCNGGTATDNDSTGADAGTGTQNNLNYSFVEKIFRCESFAPVVLTLVFGANPAQAVLDYNIYESLDNFVVEASGSINLPISIGLAPCGWDSALIPASVAICTGQSTF
jgi:hypothetical protein